MKEITGETKLVGVLADPIHHVKTPQRLNEYFARVGFDGVVVPMHAPPAQLGSVLAGLRRLENFVGAIVTVPHKTAVLEFCDTASETAGIIGAANVVRRGPDGSLAAHMLDGEGFVAGLLSCGHEVNGRSSYLAGAGGAANAIAFSLVGHGVSRLTISNRTIAKARDLRQRLLRRHPDACIELGTSDPSGHDIVVNATSLGLRDGDALPMDTRALTPGQLVCEVIMQPQETALLADARARGCTVHYGAPMLACQIAAMARFLGVMPAR